MPHASRRQLFTLVSVPAILIGLSIVVTAREPLDLDTIQGMVDDLRAQLGIQAVVSAALVPANPLLVSVQPVGDNPSTFQMDFEASFLTGLEPDELKAIVAHELGHVWIFTHHPFLQTERLANTVAMRAVPRESLERVYTKVWAREGSKGNLARFLGPQ